MHRIIVTGASRGFGKEIVKLARAAGHDVLATVRKPEDASDLAALGCHVALLDLSDRDSIASFSAEAVDWCDGGLDVLINNAGMAVPAPMAEITAANLRWQFEVNTFGHLEVTQNLLPALQAQSGRVLMISSVSAVLSNPMMGAYSASKRALEAFTEAMALETGHTNVKFVLLRPGSYSTDIFDTAKRIGSGTAFKNQAYIDLGEKIEKAAFSQPMRPPHELAELVMKIIESNNPSFIYTAPLPTKLAAALRPILPFSVFEKVLGFATEQLAKRGS